MADVRRPGLAPYVSTYVGETSPTTHDQVTAIRSWGSKHGQRIGRPMFEDAAVDGDDLECRPGLVSAILAVRKQAVAGLVVTRLDRLGAVLVAQELVIATVLRGKGNVHVVSPADARAVEHPSRDRLKLRRTVEMVLSAEQLLTARRLVDARRNRYGAANVGSLAFGQRLEGTQVVVDEDETRAIARIHELRCDGLTYPQIAAAMTAERFRTKRGAQWHPTTVQRLLQRPAGPR